LNINVTAEGKVEADFDQIKVVVRKTGLRSKSTRKIMKRWKLLVHKALEAYIANN
jgi:hypothetical protein